MPANFNITSGCESSWICNGLAKDGPLGKGHTVKKEKQEERNRFYLLVKCVPVK